MRLNLEVTEVSEMASCAAFVLDHYRVKNYPNSQEARMIFREKAVKSLRKLWHGADPIRRVSIAAAVLSLVRNDGKVSETLKRIHARERGRIGWDAYMADFQSQPRFHRKRLDGVWATNKIALFTPQDLRWMKEGAL